MAAKYWLKLYHEMLDDPKVARLPDSSYRRFIECLLLAGETDNGGFLPAIEDMAWRLRVHETSLSQDMSRLAQAGIVELKQHEEGERWFVTKFEDRQAAVSSTERSRYSRANSDNKGTSRETWRTRLYESLPSESGIYKLWIEGADKFYIGSSKNISQRIKQHLSEMKSSYHKMYEDFKLYGEEAVRAETLELAPEQALPSEETFWISQYDPQLLYNTEHTGKTHRGRSGNATATNRCIDKIREDIDKDIDKSKIKKDTPLTLPPNLDTPQFQHVWKQWKQYKGGSIKALTYEKQLERASQECNLHGVTAVCGVFEATMSNGWKGLFWEKIGNGQPYAAQGNGRINVAAIMAASGIEYND